jgi:signal transduction histidine kinase
MSDPTTPPRPDADPEAQARLANAALLVPGLVHEARHPLTGMHAGLELLAQSLGPALTGREEWLLVVDQLARLEEIFRTYQEFIAPDERPAFAFAVEPVVRRATELLRFRTRRLGPRFAVVVERGVPPAVGAPRSLLHATTNLLLNALDAAEEEGPCARVEVRVRSAAGHPQVRIADSGSGIAAAARERIFEPMFTTKGAHGTGLGLHVARRMVEASGGAVRLAGDTDPDRAPWSRTEFVVDLGRAEVEP